MTPGQCRAARSWLKWSIRKTAQEAGVSKTTVVRFEANNNVMLSTARKLEQAFERAGVVFHGKTGVEYNALTDNAGGSTTRRRPSSRSSRKR